MHNQELILLTHVSTESVNDGFLPAARNLGLSPMLLTDQTEAHRQHFSQSGLPAYPAAAAPRVSVAWTCRAISNWPTPRFWSRS